MGDIISFLVGGFTRNQQRIYAVRPLKLTTSNPAIVSSARPVARVSSSRLHERQERTSQQFVQIIWRVLEKTRARFEALHVLCKFGSFLSCDSRRDCGLYILCPFHGFATNVSDERHDVGRFERLLRFAAAVACPRDGRRS